MRIIGRVENEESRIPRHIAMGMKIYNQKGGRVSL